MVVVRKMKEKCKDAARMRREKERTEFVELSKLLPLPSSTTSQLDKASIIRLTSSYLRMRSAFPKGLGANWGRERFNNSAHHHQHIQCASDASILHQQHPNKVSMNNASSNQQQIRELGSLILQTLDGFAFALHPDGKIMYISETASVHLGLPQIDLTGSSVFEYIHPSDVNDIYELLSLNDSDRAQLEAFPGPLSGVCELGRSFCMRMKCILPKRNAGLVSNGYKVIHCSGYLKCRRIADTSINNTKQSTNLSCQSSDGMMSSVWDSYALVAVGHSLLPTASTEVKLTGNSFMFRANLDLKLYFIETSVVKLLGFEQKEMIGQSLYQFVHVADLAHLDTSHRSLLDKGQVVTKYYRLMRKNGGFIWVQSYASLVNNPRNMPKPQHVVSICFVLGDNPLDKSCILGEPEHQIRTSFAKNGFSTMENSECLGEDSKETINQLGEVSKPSRKDKHVLGVVKRNRKSRDSKDVKSTTERMQQDDCSVINKSNGKQQPNSLTITGHNNSNSTTFFLAEQQHHQQCTCLPNTHNTLNKSIGSARRPSDDTCSIVSSVASTCVSSASSSSSSSHSNNSSSSNNNNPDQFLGLYQTTNDSYTLSAISAQMDHLSQANYSYQQLSSPVKTTNTLPMNSSHLARYVDESHNLTHNQQHMLQQEPIRQVVPCVGASCLQPNTSMKTGFNSDSNIWISSISNHQLNGFGDLNKMSQVSILDENHSSSFNQSDYQQHYFNTRSDWLPPSLPSLRPPPPTTTTTTSNNHCSSTLFNHQHGQLHPSLIKVHECTEDGLSSNCLYSDQQSNSHYNQELLPHLNTTGIVHYQRPIPINNSYSMSSV